MTARLAVGFVACLAIVVRPGIGVLGSQAGNQARRTLGDVLRSDGVTEASQLPPEIRGQAISAHLTERSASGAIVLAWTREDGHLFLARYARLAGQAVPAASQWRIADLEPEPGIGGSLSNLAVHDDFIYVTRHVNPSASLSIVVSAEDLRIRRELEGWAVAVLPGGGRRAPREPGTLRADTFAGAVSLRPGERT